MAGWVWKVNVSHVFFDKNLSFEEKRDAIVATIKANDWYRDNPDLERITEHLSSAESAYEFDYWWNELYDLADIERTWIEIYA